LPLDSLVVVAVPISVVDSCDVVLVVSPLDSG
jgi:hypothetical protein